MDNNLDLLLNYYEEEKRITREYFNELIEFEDYEIAAVNLKYLTQLKRKIGILKSFSDNLYYKKTYLEERIASIKKRSAENPAESKMLRYEDRVSDLERELQLINLSPKNPIIPGNDKILNDALDKLVKKKIKGFNLILHKEENISFEIKLLSNKFRITLLNLTQAERHIGGGNYNAFQLLGFEQVTNRNKLRLWISCRKNEGFSELKTIFARIVFDVFNYRVFDNESYIQYIHND